jgi:hypothetical protein
VATFTFLVKVVFTKLSSQFGKHLEKDGNSTRASLPVFRGDSQCDPLLHCRVAQLERVSTLHRNEIPTSGADV